MLKYFMVIIYACINTSYYSYTSAFVLWPKLGKLFQHRLLSILFFNHEVFAYL